MMRRLNWPLWLGFVITIFAFVSYLPPFVRFASTRDTPWATYLLFAIGLLLVAIGVARSPRKIGASTVAVFSLALAAFLAVSEAAATASCTRAPAWEVATSRGRRSFSSTATASCAGATSPRI